MEIENIAQRTIVFLCSEHDIQKSIEGFIRDRKASNLSPNTLEFYREKLGRFYEFCYSSQIVYVSQITPDIIRSYMLYMAEVRHNNKGNIHGFYRSLRAFLYWYEREFEPDNWKNPIRKVKPPKQSQEILEPVSFDSISALLKTCIDGTFLGDRFRAILLALVDTGARASEFLAMNLDSIDETGAITISHGKGDKPRKTYLGQKSRKALRRYLNHRTDNCPALWVTQAGERLTYSGLRAIVKRGAIKANIEPPSLHGFRRAFALAMLRSGNVDIFSLQKLLGHTSLAVMRQYLAQNDEDTRQAHLKGSPVDGNF